MRKREKPPAKAAKTHQIVVRITPSTDTAIQAVADKGGLTKASWVRKLILEQLGAPQ